MYYWVPAVAWNFKISHQKFDEYCVNSNFTIFDCLTYPKRVTVWETSLYRLFQYCFRKRKSTTGAATLLYELANERIKNLTVALSISQRLLIQLIEANSLWSYKIWAYCSKFVEHYLPSFKKIILHIVWWWDFKAILHRKGFSSGKQCFFLSCQFICQRFTTISNLQTVIFEQQKNQIYWVCRRFSTPCKLYYIYFFSFCDSVVNFILLYFSKS